jgi:hypothetical protein
MIEHCHLKSLYIDEIDRFKSLPLDLSLKQISDWDEFALKFVWSWDENSKISFTRQQKLVSVMFILNREGSKMSAIKR